MTPVNVVFQCLDVVQNMGPLNERQQHYVNRAFAGLKRMEHLIARLKDITWLDSSIPLELSSVNVSSMIEEAVDLLLEVAELREVTVKVHVASDVTDIRADAIRLPQVIDNLLSNAIKYNRQGGTVVIKATREDDNLLVMVQDTGIGISAEDQPQVFDRFFRAQEGVRLKIDGSGLGLSITQGIIERHGGRIWVESEPNVGSTFYFSVPLVISDAHHAD